MQENKDIEIEKFLEGYNDKKYVVAVETDKYTNIAHLVIHDPELGKYIEEMEYTPFLYMKELPSKLKKDFYKNSDSYKAKMMAEYGINIKRLFTRDKEGNEVDRLSNGYKFLVTSNKSYNDLTKFFKLGGINIYEEKEIFYKLPLYEQFLIQTNIRLFKGFDLYSDVHKLEFDIETTGLDPRKDRVELIGLSDNKGFDTILEVDEFDADESEREILKKFFYTIGEIKPAIITGYYSENFDFPFILKRMEILGVDIKSLPTTLSEDKHIYKRKASVKFGGDTEEYEQTIMWGFNVIDTHFAVRRAKSINSEIKATGLKYITKFADAAKKDRTYIEGDKISTYLQENKLFLINPDNNEYTIIPDSLQEEADKIFKKINIEKPVPAKYQKFLDKCKEEGKVSYTSGSEIVHNYLLDDLWETREVDRIYNESSYMISKWLPTTFTRTTTIGGSGTWNLIMTAWSYNKGLAIPHKIQKREFVGGISRTLTLGISFDLTKGDYAGLYPSTQLEYDIFPKHDVTNVLRRLLNYFRDTRNVYKELAKTTKDPKLKNFYDAKQLPLKILNNSEFGWLSSVFSYWGDIDLGERVTCTGRQYLRKMCKFFIDFDFKVITVDTDGILFKYPELIFKDFNGNDLEEPVKLEDVTYTDPKGKTHKGLDCFFQKFNQENLNSKFMKIDNDGMFKAVINVSRKNYAMYVVDEKEDGTIKEKLKLVGNSIKSSNLPKYIENFLNKGIKMLIKQQPKEFIELYYDTLTQIYYKQIPAIQIASKAKIKKTIADYAVQNFLPKLMKIFFSNLIIKRKDKIFIFKENANYSLFDTFSDNKEIVDFILGYEKDETVKYTFKQIINLMREQRPDLYKKVVDFKLEEFRGNISLRKNKNKIGKVPLDIYQKKINFIVKNNFYESGALPEILNGDNFVDYFGESFMDGLKRLLPYVEKDYDGFMKSLNLYFAYHGNKNGDVGSAQAHMELAIENELIVNMGDTIYYVNNGTQKSHSDISTDNNGKMYSILVSEQDLDKTVDYNVLKYITNFNKKIEPLLICFSKIVKDTILIENPTNRQYYTEEDVKLTNFNFDTYPYDKKDIDDLYQDGSNVALFKMEDREVVFWNKMKLDPTIIFSDFILPQGMKLFESDYYRKYKDIKPKLKEFNVDLKDINSRYEEGDIVLTKEYDKFHLSIFEKGELVKEREI